MISKVLRIIGSQERRLLDFGNSQDHRITRLQNSEVPGLLRITGSQGHRILDSDNCRHHLCLLSGHNLRELGPEAAAATFLLKKDSNFDELSWIGYIRGALPSVHHGRMPATVYFKTPRTIGGPKA